MSGIEELAERVAADKNRSDELEAAMARTGDIADQVAGSFLDLGARGKAAQIDTVTAQLGQARNTRWLAEGHLEDALSVLQAVAEGQAGSSGTGAQSAAAADTEQESPPKPAGSWSYTTELDGKPVEVVVVPPEPEHDRGPSGETLVEEASERRGSFSRGSQTVVRRFDDLADSAKQITNTQYDAARALNPPPTQTNTTTQQPELPQLNPVPRPDVDVGDAANAALAIGAMTAAYTAKKLEARRRKKENP